MTSRKVTATEWIVNENKLSQAPLVAWHVLSSIWVHFGTWGLIFLVKNQFSHIFPASAWSPYQSLFLRHEIEKRLRAVYFVVKIFQPPVPNITLLVNQQTIDFPSEADSMFTIIIFYVAWLQVVDINLSRERGSEQN